MVYVLGRMGSADKALRLIVEGLRDVAQAVEFVQLQRDDDLWEPLIALTLGDARLTGVQRVGLSMGHQQWLGRVSLLQAQQVRQQMQRSTIAGELLDHATVTGGSQTSFQTAFSFCCPTGELLDHAGGYIDPLRVVSQIPEHMQVENLRGRLVKIITDFRTQVSRAWCLGLGLLGMPSPAPQRLPWRPFCMCYAESPASKWARAQPVVVH
jgi:hypothetical protein